jgi:hypothetical protein
MDVPTIAYGNYLAVEILDTQRKGHAVYRASVYTITGQDALRRIMPSLTQALFDDFPSGNGVKRQIGAAVND